MSARQAAPVIQIATNAMNSAINGLLSNKNTLEVFLKRCLMTNVTETNKSKEIITAVITLSLITKN